jgi:hypothetical protein
MKINPAFCIFPCANGDTLLIETPDRVILTDINYRSACGEDDAGMYDFASELRKACHRPNGAHELDIFALTHPDRDHLCGYSTFFHLGSPSSYKPTGKDPLIFVKEIWASPYAIVPGYTTDISKPVLDEIQRRHKLQGTDLGNADGNRLKVLSMDEPQTEGQVGQYLTWQLLAPTAEEADIEAPTKDNPQPSSNDSSLVIRWTLKNGDKIAHILLAGDATVNIWERLWQDYRHIPEALSWHVLVAPHHCSRGVMARKNPLTDKYEYSQDALNALGQVKGDGFVVSSSKEIKNDDDNPPSWDAKQKYLDILCKAAPYNVESRFLNPETHKAGEPAPVEVELTHRGITCKVPQKAAAVGPSIALGGSHGSYGSE